MNSVETKNGTYTIDIAANVKDEEIITSKGDIKLHARLIGLVATMLHSVPLKDRHLEIFSHEAYDNEDADPRIKAEPTRIIAIRTASAQYELTVEEVIEERCLLRRNKFRLVRDNGQQHPPCVWFKLPTGHERLYLDRL